MAKTWLSVIMAFPLVAISAALFVMRWRTQGADVAGPYGDQTWQVTMTATGEWAAHRGALTSLAPLDFRGQHIFDERFESKELVHRVMKKKPGQREAHCRRSGTGGQAEDHVTYSLRCVAG